MASTDNSQPSGQAAVKTADYDSYFINMVVLNRSDYGIHARKVWDDIKANETPAKEAIQNYLTQYRELYSAANKGAEIPAADAAEIRGRLVPQIDQLQKIELSIKGIRPTPELIADNFIDTRVRPVEGISEEKIEAVRSAIVNYESMEVTPEEAIKTMRDSWESKKIEPETIDHYTEILKQKIEHYQSGEGGNLDGATASARAAVDIRAQMDRDHGVPDRAIVDENHSYYQSDILTMGNWMHGKIYMQKFGTMDNLNGFAYSVHRRNNIEQSMDKAFKDPSGRLQQTPQEKINPASQNIKDGQGIKSDIPTTTEFNGKSGNTTTKPEPPPETYNDDAVPVITEDEPQTATTKTTTFNTDFNAI